MPPVDPFALPGMIKTSTKISVDDVSSDDDDEADVWLKSGKEKQAALREREKQRNLKAQAEGTKPSDAESSTEPASSAPSAEVEMEEVQPPPSSSKRRGSGRKAPAKRGKTRASPGADVDLQEKAADLDRQEAALREVSRKRALGFALDDADDELPAPSRGARSRGGAGSSAAASTGAGSSRPDAPARTIWLKVLCDGVTHLVGGPLEATLEVSGILRKAAEAHGLDASRVVLRFCDGELNGGEPTPGAKIDLSKTPRELGLCERGEGGPPRVWVEEVAQTFIKLKLRRSDKVEVEVKVPPSGTVAALKLCYCQQHGTGITPAQVRMEVDGEALADAESLKTCVDGDALEDGDLVEVFHT